jgi:hypothetical protein
MWLISVHRPRLLVELGTYRGTSYCAFCQAIKSLDLSSRAFAVDTWRGDSQNGPNGPEILDELAQYHDLRYRRFSKLLEMTFDQAVSQFRDGEIDLLHCDGCHTYEAIRHDYEIWRPKLSERGVILFHDIAEHVLEFGVSQFWDELRTQYPSFQFQHEHGLGVLAVGRDLPEEIRALTTLDTDAAERLRTFFYQLGHRLRLESDYNIVLAELDDQKSRVPVVSSEHKRSDERDELYVYIGTLRAALRKSETRLDELRQEIDEVRSEQDTLKLEHDTLQSEHDTLKSEHDTLKSEHDTLKSEHDTLKEENQTLLQELVHLEQERAEFEQSISWSVAQRLVRLGASVAPPRSVRRRLVKNLIGPAQDPRVERHGRQVPRS